MMHNHPLANQLVKEIYKATKKLPNLKDGKHSFKDTDVNPSPYETPEFKDIPPFNTKKVQYDVTIKNGVLVDKMRIIYTNSLWNYSAEVVANFDTDGNLLNGSVNRTSYEMHNISSER